MFWLSLQFLLSLVNTVLFFSIFIVVFTFAIVKTILKYFLLNRVYTRNNLVVHPIVSKSHISLDTLLLSYTSITITYTMLHIYNINIHYILTFWLVGFYYCEKHFIILCIILIKFPCLIFQLNNDNIICINITSFLFPDTSPI